MKQLRLNDLEQYDPKPAIYGLQSRFLCPLCGDDKPKDNEHRSLSVNRETGVWKCHRCGMSGFLSDSCRNHQRSNNLFAVTDRNNELDEKQFSRLRYRLKSVRPIAGTPAESYLIKRKVSVRIAEQAGVMYSHHWSCETSILLRDWVVFPVKDNGGQLVAASGRAVLAASG